MTLRIKPNQKNDVFVGNIPYGTTEQQIHSIFSEAGRVVNIRSVVDHETGKPKGYAFVEFEDSATALSAIRNLNGYECNGRQLRVNYSSNSSLSEKGTPISAVQIAAENSVKSVVENMPVDEIREILIQMKMLAQNEPDASKTLLESHPQLAEAILQMQQRVGMKRPVKAEINSNAGTFAAPIIQPQVTQSQTVTPQVLPPPAIPIPLPTNLPLPPMPPVTAMTPPPPRPPPFAPPSSMVPPPGLPAAASLIPDTHISNPIVPSSNPISTSDPLNQSSQYQQSSALESSKVIASSNTPANFTSGTDDQFMSTPSKRSHPSSNTTQDPFWSMPPSGPHPVPRPPRHIPTPPPMNLDPYDSYDRYENQPKRMNQMGHQRRHDANNSMPSIMGGQPDNYSLSNFHGESPLSKEIHPGSTQVVPPRNAMYQGARGKGRAYPRGKNSYQDHRNHQFSDGYGSPMYPERDQFYPQHQDYINHNNSYYDNYDRKDYHSHGRGGYQNNRYDNPY